MTNSIRDAVNANHISSLLVPLEELLVELNVLASKIIDEVIDRTLAARPKLPPYGVGFLTDQSNSNVLLGHRPVIDSHLTSLSHLTPERGIHII